jgi:hypothetical protein
MKAKAKKVKARKVSQQEQALNTWLEGIDLRIGKVERSLAECWKVISADWLRRNNWSPGDTSLPRHVAPIPVPGYVGFEVDVGLACGREKGHLGRHIAFPGRSAGCCQEMPPAIASTEGNGK